jgi:hypothetical protein
MNYRCLIWSNFLNFVALLADVIETPVSCASRSRDFIGEVSSLAPMSSNVSSVSTVCFSSAFLSSNDPVFFQFIDQLMYILSTWHWFSWKLALKFSATFSGRLIFETEFHETHAFQ